MMLPAKAAPNELCIDVVDHLRRIREGPASPFSKRDLMIACRQAAALRGGFAGKPEGAASFPCLVRSAPAGRRDPVKDLGAGLRLVRRRKAKPS